MVLVLLALVAIAPACLLIGPASAEGATWVVDPSGGGDFTSVQAAVDSAVATESNPEQRPDSVLVAPGYYDEEVYLPGMGSPAIVLGSAAGPSTATIRRFCVIGCLGSEQLSGESPAPPAPSIVPPHGWIVSGMTIVDSLWIGGISTNHRFLNCSFLGNVRVSDFASGRIAGCQFFGGAEFINCFLAVEDSRFIGSRVFVRVADSWTRIERCVFEGPVDTAIVHQDGAHTDALRLIDCTFKNVGVAVASVRWQASTGGVWAESCRFEDIGNVAFTWDHEGGLFPSNSMSPLLIRDSHFLRCQRVLDWGGHHPALVLLERDTLELCGPSSIRGTVHPGYGAYKLGYQEPHVTDLVAIGQQGKLFDFALHTPAREWDEPAPTDAKLVLARLRVEGAGDTLGVIHTLDWPGFTSGVSLTDSWLEGGTIRVTTDSVTASGNTFVQSGGHALELALRGPTPLASIHHNTILESLGDGLHVATDDGSPVVADIHHNLLVQNAGDGIHIGSPYSGSIAFNDAWLNYGTAYFGGGSLDSNLTVDPVFCDLLAGDLTVSSVSPCAPTGPYGQIGAHGVGCTRLEDAGPGGRPAASLVWPNPARGWVELTPPGRVPGWRIEIFDIQGRRVWQGGSAPSGAATRWVGETDTGESAGPGLYWVRFSSARGIRRVSRLVWLE